MTRDEGQANAITTCSDELDRQLAATYRTFMVTRRRDGSVTCHPMAKFYAERGLYLNMYASSAKYKNLVRDPRTFLLCTSWSYDPVFAAVAIEGSARVLSAEETLADDAPAGVVEARGIGMEGVKKVEDKPEKFIGEDPEDWLKRAAVMVERIRDRVRLVIAIDADSVRWLRDVREAEV
jgi:hypothetical protein